MKDKESNFAKCRLCWRWVNVICFVCLMITCGQMFIAKHIECFGLDCLYVLNLSISVLYMLMLGMGIILGLFMIHYAKCPHCGKSVLSKWWNYGRLKQIRKCQTIICAHCGEEVETK